jgi:hypothetical protein
MKVMAFIILLISHGIMANTAKLENLIINPVKVGQTSRMTYLFWDVYDATLYAPNGKYKANNPFILQLDYLRDLKGEDIAQRSIEEMKKQGYSDEAKLTLWLDSMKNIFPNVRNGSQLIGLRNSDGESLFYSGEQLLGKIEDPDFTKHFFDIWLSEKTSEPEMRKELLAIQDRS